MHSAYSSYTVLADSFHIFSVYSQIGSAYKAHTPKNSFEYSEWNFFSHSFERDAASKNSMQLDPKPTRNNIFPSSYSDNMQKDL
jgi:hypothetical protein